MAMMNMVHAQDDLHFATGSDTAFWYKYKNDLVKRFRLGQIEHDGSPFTFRFWGSGLTVWIRCDAKVCAGEVSCFVVEYKKDKEGKPFVKHYPIEPVLVRQLQELVDSMEIDMLPSDKYINGWKQGFDGVEYLVEGKRNEQFFFRTYWTPSFQYSVKEAELLESFVHRMYDLLGVEEINRQFSSEIPFDRWTVPGSGLVASRVKYN